MELNAEYIDVLRQACNSLYGDIEHTKFITMDDIRDDILFAFPDTIITTVPLSVVVTELMKEKCQLVGTRKVNNIECAEFMMLAPFVMRVAVLGTDFCVDGEYIMFRASDFEPQEEDRPAPTVLVRQGIQG